MESPNRSASLGSPQPGAGTLTQRHGHLIGTAAERVESVWRRPLDSGGWGIRRHLAQPHLVPTRDWGVVVDTASVPETNLADSRS